MSDEHAFRIDGNPIRSGGNNAKIYQRWEVVWGGEGGVKRDFTHPNIFFKIYYRYVRYTEPKSYQFEKRYKCAVIGAFFNIKFYRIGRKNWYVFCFPPSYDKNRRENPSSITFLLNFSGDKMGYSMSYPSMKGIDRAGNEIRLNRRNRFVFSSTSRRFEIISLIIGTNVIKNRERLIVFVDYPKYLNILVKDCNSLGCMGVGQNSKIQGAFPKKFETEIHFPGWELVKNQKWTNSFLMICSNFLKPKNIFTLLCITFRTCIIIFFNPTTTNLWLPPPPFPFPSPLPKKWQHFIKLPMFSFQFQKWIHN